MAPFPTPISTCNNNTVFNSLPWLTNNFSWKTNREYYVSTHDCDALYWFGCMYSSCIDSILAWWARIWLYTPELCMTLAPLAPPQTYCAASQTNTTQRNPLRGGSNDASRKKLSFIIKQISIIEDKSHKWAEGCWPIWYLLFGNAPKHISNGLNSLSKYILCKLKLPTQYFGKLFNISGMCTCIF